MAVYYSLRAVMKNLRSTIFVLSILSTVLLLQGVGEALEVPNISSHTGRSECCLSVEDLKVQPAGAREQNSERPADGTACDLCPSCLDVDITNPMILSCSSLLGEVIPTREALPLLAGHTLPLLKPPQP